MPPAPIIEAPAKWSKNIRQMAHYEQYYQLMADLLYTLYLLFSKTWQDKK